VAKDSAVGFTGVTFEGAFPPLSVSGGSLAFERCARRSGRAARPLPVLVAEPCRVADDRAMPVVYKAL
jgi:hypothetical protein